MALVKYGSVFDIEVNNYDRGCGNEVVYAYKLIGFVIAI